MSEQNYQAWLRSKHEPPRLRHPSSNTVEVRFDIERVGTDQQGDEWLREQIRLLLQQGAARFEHGRIVVESVRIVD